MFSPSTVILDCGSSRTALGVFELKCGRLRCVAQANEIFATPAESDAQWLQATRAALFALRPQFPALSAVVLLLPGHLTFLKLIPVPRVARRQREKVLRFAAQQNLPSGLEEVGWDGTVVAAGEQIDQVLLAAAKLEILEPLCALVHEAGFWPQVVLPSPLATLASYRLSAPTSSDSVVVLNLGARSTSLLLLGTGVGAVRTLPFGGNQLTRQLAEREAGEFWQAEERKLTADGASLLGDATEQWAARLGQEITRTIDTYRRQDETVSPTRVLVTGGNARLPGLLSALTSRLNLPVELLLRDAPLECAGWPNHPSAAHERCELTDLFGAAATQLLPDRPQLNLLPPRHRREARNRQRLPWLLAAMLLLVAALLPPIRQERQRTLEARSEQADLEQALIPIRMQAESMAADLQQIAACRREITQLQALVERRTSWLELLADLQAALAQVQDVWLDSLQLIPAPSPAPLQLSLKGRLLTRDPQQSESGRDRLSRLKALLQAIERLPGLTVAPTGRQFDHSQPGFTHFDLIVVVDPAHLL